MNLEQMGRSMRAMRKQAGKSVSQTARKTGVGEGTLYAYESGKINPGLVNLCLLAEYYGVTLDELVFSGGKA